jgi:hypothetical protein
MRILFGEGVQEIGAVGLGGRVGGTVGQGVVRALGGHIYNKRLRAHAGKSEGLERQLQRNRVDLFGLLELLPRDLRESLHEGNPATVYYTRHTSWW